MPIKRIETVKYVVNKREFDTVEEAEEYMIGEFAYELFKQIHKSMPGVLITSDNEHTDKVERLAKHMIEDRERWINMLNTRIEDNTRVEDWTR